MANEVQTAIVDRERVEVIYSGQYAEVAKERGTGLIACPREVLEWNEEGYLFHMIDELKDVYDKVAGNGELGEIYVGVQVIRDDIRHVLEVGKGGSVRVVAREYGYCRFIRRADKVEIEVFDDEAVKGADRDAVVYDGPYATLVKGEGGLLRAYASKALALKPDDHMIGVIKTVEGRFEDQLELWGIEEMEKAAEVQGLVWRKRVAYRPVVSYQGYVEFVPVNRDYVDIVKAADLILFSRPVC